MTPFTQRDILAHQQQVPWPNLRQVEQGLLLCCAVLCCAVPCCAVPCHDGIV